MNRALVAGLVSIGFLAGLVAAPTWDGDPGCHEDEVYAVQIDTDPTHGLTWECENVEDYLERAARG